MSLAAAVLTEALLQFGIYRHDVGLRTAYINYNYSIIYMLRAVVYVRRLALADSAYDAGDAALAVVVINLPRRSPVNV